MFVEDYAGKILPFDGMAATEHPDIFAARRRGGRPGQPSDLMIAAIALSRDAAVVTRNVAHFDGCGVTVINPWGE